MEVMLDTNAYSDWMRSGDWREVISGASMVSISAVSLGELFHGFRKGNRCQKNTGILRNFLRGKQVKVCPIDVEVAEVFGGFLDYLQKQGTPLPSNDIWIAACAYVRGAQLLTRDNHFERLPQIKVIGLEG